jgi:hypothetical protein
MTAGAMPRRLHVAIAMWVCLGTAGPARGQNAPPRVVAVIDATAGATSDPAVTTLAARIESQIDREDDLVPVASDRRPALVGGVPDETLSAITEARSALSRGRDEAARFDHEKVIAEADRGLARAVNLPPDAELAGLLADLAFERGLARFYRNDKVEAARDFTLVHRLAPGRKLNDIQYFDEIIQLFEQAAEPGKSAALDVAAPAGATVWVDAAKIGEAPAVVTLPVGLHVVTITGDKLVSRGQLVEVPEAGAQVRIDAADATGSVIVQRLRRRVAAAGDEVARADAVAALVREVGGQDAVVVGYHDEVLVTWIYSGRTGSLGDPKPAEGRAAGDIVKPLRPIVVPRRDPRPTYEIPPPIEPWWQKRWIQASIGGGLLLGVVTTVLLLQSGDRGTSTVTIGGFGTEE